MAAPSAPAAKTIPVKFVSKVAKADDEERLIMATCEKGTVENTDALKLLNKERAKRMKQYPNLVDYEAKLCFKSFYEHAPMPEHGTPVKDIVVKKTLLGAS